MEKTKLERLHIRIVGNTIDVLYRPNHNYLIFLNNDKEGKEKIKELAQMTRDQFVNFLRNIENLPRFTSNDLDSILNSKSEEWYQGAWKHDTEKILKEIGVSNPIEDPIFSNELRLEQE